MRIGSVVLAASVLALGCDDAAARRQACEARVARLEQTLASLPAPRIGGPVPAGIQPASTTGGSSPVEASAPIIAIGSNGELRLDGRALPDGAALVGDLDTLRRHWSILHPGTHYPAVVHVWADRDLTIATLRARLSAVRDHRVVVLAVAPSDPVALPPCPSSLGETCTRLPTLEANARADELGRAWARSLGACEPLRALSAEIASALHHDREQVLRAGLPTALRACGCGHFADEDAIEYVAAVVLTNPFDPAVRALELPAPSDADEATTVGAWMSAIGS